VLDLGAVAARLAALRDCARREAERGEHLFDSGQTTRLNAGFADQLDALLRDMDHANTPAGEPVETCQQVHEVAQEANRLNGVPRGEISEQELEARSALISSARVYRKTLHSAENLNALRAEYHRDLLAFRATPGGRVRTQGGE